MLQWMDETTTLPQKQFVLTDSIVKMLAYVIHNRRDGGRIDRSLCFKRLDVVQRIGIKQLRKTNAQ